MVSGKDQINEILQAKKTMELQKTNARIFSFCWCDRRVNRRVIR
jgi:retron-type reverse transcriptase